MKFLYSSMKRTMSLLVPAALLLGVALAPGAAAQGDGAGFRLPDMGAPDQVAISAHKEREIGRSMLLELRRKDKLVADPEVSRYVRRLGRRLAAASDEPGLTFTFFTIDDPAINAFAAPGGYIGVNTGLITATESESELAAVIAHEIAHVTQRHIARRVEAVDRMAVPSIAALLAAVAIGSQDGQAGAAALAAAQAGALQYQIDFTRANEKEADRVGIQTLARSDYDPHSMASFFERLQTATRYYSRPPEYLSTHPVTVNRIADSRSRAESFPYRQYPDSRAYALVRAKLRVQMAESPREAVERMTRALESGQYRDETAARYGVALAQRAAGRLEAARAGLRALFEAHPEHIPLRYELARTAARAGDPEAALELFSEGLELYPSDRMLAAGYAELLLTEGRPARAREVLARHIADYGGNARLHRLRARAEELSGHPVAAHMALAEHHYAAGDLEAAIAQLERARRQGGADDYQASRIAARLERWRREQDLTEDPEEG